MNDSNKKEILKYINFIDIKVFREEWKLITSKTKYNNSFLK